MGFVGLGWGRFGGHLGDRGGRAACRNEGATYASWSLPRSSQAMARAITFVSIQGVVNFLTLRPAPLLVCHMGSHPLVTRSIPLSRVHRVENTEYNTRNIPGHLPDSVGRRLDYSELFCRFLCHRVRFPARTCVIGVCRALQKTASKASHSLPLPLSFSTHVLFLSFRGPCPQIRLSTCTKIAHPTIRVLLPSCCQDCRCYR